MVITVLIIAICLMFNRRVVVQEDGVYLGYYYGVPREIRDIDYLPLTPEEMKGISY